MYALEVFQNLVYSPSLVLLLRDVVFPEIFSCLPLPRKDPLLEGQTVASCPITLCCVSAHVLSAVLYLVHSSLGAESSVT